MLLTLEQKLELIYARIPKLSCQRLCQECCGPIRMSQVEYIRIFNKPPAPGEYFLGKATAINLVTNSCPKLGRDGSCRVYEIRPLICRLWGVVKAMACPFGCEPERWLSDKESRRLIDEIEALR